MRMGSTSPSRLPMTAHYPNSPRRHSQSGESPPGGSIPSYIAPDDLSPLLQEVTDFKDDPGKSRGTEGKARKNKACDHARGLLELSGHTGNPGAVLAKN